MTQQPPPPRHVRYQPQSPGNGLAIASLILGIIACVFFCIPVLRWMLGAGAVVLGVVAIVQAGPIGNAKAKAGIILGVLGLALGIGFSMAARATVSYFNRKAPLIQKQIEDAAKRAEEEQRKAEQEIEKQKQNQSPATQPGSMRMDRFREGEAPAEPQFSSQIRLGGSLALPLDPRCRAAFRYEFAL
jgi:hypothetical protein